MLGAKMHFNTEFEAFEEDGQRAHIRNRTTGEEETVVADYLMQLTGPTARYASGSVSPVAAPAPCSTG